MMAGPRRIGLAIALLVAAAALLLCCTPVEARKATGGVHKDVHKNVAPKLKDASHVSRKFKAYKDAKSGRTGHVLDRGVSAPLQPAPLGRRLLQATGDTTIVAGMSVCMTALDAANFIVGTHATQMTVSNAAFTKGACSVATYAAQGGLQWGIVQAWPADHAMGPMFGGAGALLLSCGDVAEAQRVVNDADGFTADNQLDGDTDLDALIPGYTTFDAVSLEFSVTPAKSGELVFSYVFASEEYNEWVDSPFNDVFGFWVSGPGIVGPGGSDRVNVAYIDLVTPVSINNINNGKTSQYYNDNDLEPRPTVWPPPSPFNTSYDGFTSLLNTRPVSVQAGQTYKFKLAIADAGDHVLDSSVWIAGGSLLVNNPPKVSDDGPFALACPGTITMHANGTDDDNDSLHFTWSLTNLADPNIHIAKTTAAPTLTMPDDGIPAGNYSVVLTAIDSHGSRSSTTSTLRVAACPAPAGNRAPTAIIGGPYTLPLCNGVGSIVMDASSSFDADAGADKVTGFTWEISSATSDFELKLTGPSVAVSGGMGLYAGNVYEVEVFVRDSYGASSAAETTLTVVPAPGCSATSGSSGGGSSGGGSGGGGSSFTEAKITGGPYVLANCASSLTLDGSASTSFDGQPLAFQWDFWLAATQEVFTVPAMGADGATPAIPDATAPLSMATHTWLQPGQTYDVTLNVQDSTGAWASDITTLTTPATCNSAPTAAATATSYTIPCKGSATLNGSPSSDPDAGDVLSYAWSVFAKGSLVNPLATSNQAAFTIAYNTLLMPTTSSYDAYLTVTDAAGASSTTTKITVLAPSCGNPPVAKLSGAPYSLSAGGTTQVDGTSSSDPDGNDDIASITFNVLDANKAMVVSKTSGTLGKASLSQLGDGLKTNTIYTLQLVVADKAGNTGTANTTLTVGNAKPVPVIKFVPAAQVACGGSVTLDATASTDDGVISTYAWKLVSGTSSVTKSGATAIVSQTTDKLTSGAVYNVTLTVTDDKGASVSAVATLTVAAGCVVNTPPVCTNAKANVTRISTLNHALIPVTVTGVTDANVGDIVTISITGVTQDESVITKSDTATTWTCPDAVISGAAVKLSAEALSTSPNNGRVYVIAYKATDKAGASCTGTVKVCARTGTIACVEETTKFNSTKCA